MTSHLKISLARSLAGCTEAQRKIAFGLGLMKREKVVWRYNDAPTRGMVKKIYHLLKVEESTK